MEYKGYTIKQADQRYGKAGAGRNKTSTIQVLDFSRGGCMLQKQIRFTKSSLSSRHKAIEKAKEWVDSNPLPAKH